MTTPILIVVALVCVNLLTREAWQQIRQRLEIEGQLRQERGLLEERIALRTEELQAEIEERKRAERLNRGRTVILEMLMNEKPAKEILCTLVEVVAKDRSSWGCVLHLLEDGELRMQSSCGLPAKLLGKLEQFPTPVADAPESMALRERRTQVVEDLSRERKPWLQLLYAYGIQTLCSTPIYAPDGTPLGTLTIYSLLLYVSTGLDRALLESQAQMAAMVLERYRLQEELRRHAFHDSLTGLPNRLLGKRQLSASICRGQRVGKTVAVFWIDLDKFKQTNDSHGHNAGDTVLREVAGRLSRRFRESDTVARMGGDEFMAVLENVANRADAERIATSLVKELAIPIPFEGLMLNTAASIGIALYPEDGETADLLEHNADLAMYEAKFGRHGFRAFSPALACILSERRELEQAMMHALEHGGFMLHYQPQYEPGGRLAGFEALLRFPHPVMGMVSPARLIPIAEESQMIVALGNWVVREACQQIQRWQRAGLPLVPVAVNISAMQFARENFADEVAEVLDETGIAAALLELELTESVMVKDFVESARQLHRLKLLGVSIAVDDFGTGYSSLNQLHRLPINRLKIDRSFTQALCEPNGTVLIVEGIISMAHCMGMKVVGEGVETTEQMKTLDRMECDFFQGFLMSKPVDAAQAGLLLRAGVWEPITASVCA